ncbi:MAG: hypothetical protein ABSG22_01355 [Sedimentisphaerales bacterium]|jgi:hypothetical protein
MDKTQTVKGNSIRQLAENRESLGEILLALQSPLTPEEQQYLWQCFELLLERSVEEKKK